MRHPSGQSKYSQALKDLESFNSSLFRGLTVDEKEFKTLSRRLFVAKPKQKRKPILAASSVDATNSISSEDIPSVSQAAASNLSDDGVLEKSREIPSLNFTEKTNEPTKSLQEKPTTRVIHDNDVSSKNPKSSQQNVNSLPLSHQPASTENSTKEEPLGRVRQDNSLNEFTSLEDIPLNKLPKLATSFSMSNDVQFGAPTSQVFDSPPEFSDSADISGPLVPESFEDDGPAVDDTEIQIVNHERAESILIEEFQVSATELSKLKEKNFKSKKDALVYLTKLVLDGDLDPSKTIMLLFSLLRKYPSWKESNSLVCVQMFDLLRLLVHRSSKCSENLISLLFPSILSKGGDIKAFKAISNLLHTAEASITPDVVLKLWLPLLEKEKNPKAITAFLCHARDTLHLFGIKQLDWLGVAKEAKSLLSNTNKKIKDACIDILLEIYQQGGQSLENFLLSDIEDRIKVSVQNTFSECSPYSSYTPSISIRKRFATTSDSQTIGVKESKLNSISSSDPLDLIPKVDISKKISSSTLKNFSSDNWKERNASLDEVKTVLDSVPSRVEVNEVVHDLIKALHSRFKDPNKNLVTKALRALNSLALLCGREGASFSVLFFDDISLVFADTKKIVVGEAISMLQSWLSIGCFSYLRKNFSKILKNVAARAAFLKTIVDFEDLDYGDSDSDGSGFVKSLLNCLLDKSSSVRDSASAILKKARLDSERLESELRSFSDTQVRTMRQLLVAKGLCDSSEPVSSSKLEAKSLPVQSPKLSRATKTPSLQKSMKRTDHQENSMYSTPSKQVPANRKNMHVSKVSSSKALGNVNSVVTPKRPLPSRSINPSSGISSTAGIGKVDFEFHDRQRKLVRIRSNTNYRDSVSLKQLLSSVFGFEIADMLFSELIPLQTNALSAVLSICQQNRVELLNISDLLFAIIAKKFEEDRATIVNLSCDVCESLFSMFLNFGEEDDQVRNADCNIIVPKLLSHLLGNKKVGLKRRGKLLLETSVSVFGIENVADQMCKEISMGKNILMKIELIELFVDLLSKSTEHASHKLLSMFIKALLPLWEFNDWNVKSAVEKALISLHKSYTSEFSLLTSSLDGKASVNLRKLLNLSTTNLRPSKTPKKLPTYRTPSRQVRSKMTPDSSSLSVSAKSSTDSDVNAFEDSMISKSFELKHGLRTDSGSDRFYSTSNHRMQRFHFSPEKVASNFPDEQSSFIKPVAPISDFRNSNEAEIGALLHQLEFGDKVDKKAACEMLFEYRSVLDFDHLAILISELLRNVDTSETELVDLASCLLIGVIYKLEGSISIDKLSTRKSYKEEHLVSLLASFCSVFGQFHAAFKGTSRIEKCIFMIVEYPNKDDRIVIATSAVRRLLQAYPPQSAMPFLHSLFAGIRCIEKIIRVDDGFSFSDGESIARVLDDVIRISPDNSITKEMKRVANVILTEISRRYPVELKKISTGLRYIRDCMPSLDMRMYTSKPVTALLASRGVGFGSNADPSRLEREIVIEKVNNQEPDAMEALRVYFEQHPHESMSGLFPNKAIYTINYLQEKFNNYLSNQSSGRMLPPQTSGHNVHNSVLSRRATLSSSYRSPEGLQHMRRTSGISGRFGGMQQDLRRPSASTMRFVNSQGSSRLGETRSSVYYRF